MNSTDRQVSCSSCGSENIQNYCAVCGQKVTGRLTTKSLIREALNRAFNLERGFFFTFWQLFKRPAGLVDDYISGKRVIYQNPFSYLVLSLAAISLSLFFVSSQEHVEILMSDAARENPDNPFLNGKFNEYLNLFFFSIVPVMALLTWLFFRKSKLNFAEHLITNVYAFSQINFINAIFSFVIFTAPEEFLFAIEGVATLTGVIYLIYLHSGVFRSGVWGVFKSLFAYIISHVVLTLLIYAIMKLFGISG